MPEPWKGVFNAIDPESIYLIQEISQSGEPVRVRRVKADQPAKDLHESEIAMSAERLRIRRVRGTDLRALVVHLAETHGVFPMGIAGCDFKTDISETGI